MFSGADQTGYVVASERTRARVQVIEQQAERLGVEFDDGELGLGQFGTIDFLDVGADAEPRHGQTVAVAGGGSCPVGGRSPLTASFSTDFS